MCIKVPLGNLCFTYLDFNLECELSLHFHDSWTGARICKSVKVHLTGHFIKSSSTLLFITYSWSAYNWLSKWRLGIKSQFRLQINRHGRISYLRQRTHKRTENARLKSSYVMPKCGWPAQISILFGLAAHKAI